MPFCQVSRLMTQTSGSVVGVEAETLLHGAAGWRSRAFKRALWRTRHEIRVARRIPGFRVDAVDDAMQVDRRGC